MKREPNTDQLVTLLHARELFLPLHKLKLGLGNSSRTKCDFFTAGGYLIVKTNTGDYKGQAQGELWPAISLSMARVKQLAKIYKASDASVQIECDGNSLKLDTTIFRLNAQ